MVKIGLQIKANLSNVTKLYPKNLDEFEWNLKVKCTGCGEENPNWQSISSSEEVQLSNGAVNFQYKCKFCSRENSLSIIAPNDPHSKELKKLLNAIYEDDDDGKFKTIVSFDCRGLELIDFQPGDGWCVDSESKTFQDVDLTDKEWVEYNDKNNEPVEINNVEHKFITLK